MNKQWCRVEPNEDGCWEVIQITEQCMYVHPSREAAEKFAESTGFQVLMHWCYMGCNHG